MCCATPTRTTVLTDVVVYDFDYFGRVAIPVTEHGYLAERLGFHDDAWRTALRLYEEAGGVTVTFDEYACPLEDQD